MPDVAAMWKAEYNGMLQDLYRAEKDMGDVDMAAFRQEGNLNVSNHNWWADPMVDRAPGGWGDQV